MTPCLPEAHCVHHTSSVFDGANVTDKGLCCHCGTRMERKGTDQPDPAHGAYCPKVVRVWFSGWKEFAEPAPEKPLVLEEIVKTASNMLITLHDHAS